MNPSVEESLSISEGLPTSTKSLFDALRVPALADLTQKRAIHCNPRTCRAHGEGSSELKEYHCYIAGEEIS